MSTENDQSPHSQKPLSRNVNYLMFIAGQSVSMVGTEATAIAFPLLTIAISGSATWAGIVTALYALPYPIFSLFAGALVDRWNRRMVMIICDTVRAATMLSVPLAYILGSLTLLQLAVVAFVSGTAFVFFNVAEVASFRQIAGVPRLARATSNQEVAESVAGLGGPALGGVIIGAARTQQAGGAIAFLVDGVTFVASVFSLSFIRTPLHSAQTGVKRNILVEIIEGLRFLWGHSTIRTIAFLSAALNLWLGPAFLAIIVLAQDNLGQSPTVVGLIFSTAGAAGIGGALVAPLLQNRVRVGLVITSAVVAWAMAMLILPLANSAYMLALGWGLVVFISPLYDVNQLSYRLSLIPNEFQGRVNSSFRFMAWSIRPVSLAAGGVVITTFGARPVLWMLFAGMAVTALIAVTSNLRRAQ